MASTPLSDIGQVFPGPGGSDVASPETVFRLLTARTPVGIFVASSNGRYEYVNERWSELTGLDGDRALGSAWCSALHPEDVGRAAAGWSDAVDSASEWIDEHRFVRPDGSVVWIECHAHTLHDESGALIGWVGACLDVTPHKEAASAAAAHERFRVAFENAPTGMALVTPDGSWLHVNAALCRLLGYSADDLLTLELIDLTVPGDATIDLNGEDELRHERRYLRADGTPLWVASSTTLVRAEDGEPLYYVLQIEDIGDRKQTERELRRLADHDGLTGLLNRRGFMEGLRRELRRMERKDEYGALLLLDLDNFKLVNDTAGHLAGDQVLRTTAEVLRRRLRATDVIGRLGGDEFAALVLNVTPRQANEIAEETTDTLRAMTVTAGDVTIPVAASIGVIAIDELHGVGEEELIAAADRAMYRVKSLRRDR
jgi:diguanylate cyclase (GGDEF)-like protein/PAS domain S-box-containing protein